jgi:hypothetical protein
MRIYEKHQNYRYAKKTQISLEPKKSRYVGMYITSEKKAEPLLSLLLLTEIVEISF